MKSRKLNKEQQREIAAIAIKADAGIDFSDIPLRVDWSGAAVGKFYRPVPLSRADDAAVGKTGRCKPA